MPFFVARGNCNYITETHIIDGKEEQNFLRYSYSKDVKDTSAHSRLSLAGNTPITSADTHLQQNTLPLLLHIDMDLKNILKASCSSVKRHAVNPNRGEHKKGEEMVPK